MAELFAYPLLDSPPMRRVAVTEDEQHRFGLAAGDLLFARRSLVDEGAGKCSLVCRVSGPTVFESSIIRVRPDPAKVSPRYLFYLFQSGIGRQKLYSIRRAMAVSGITGSDLAELYLPVPDRKTQERVAAALSALDAKILANGNLTRHCDLLWLSAAQRILRDDGNPSKQVRLSQVAEFINGGAYTKAATGTGRMVVRIAELNSGPGPSTVYTDREVPVDHLARPGDLLFSWSGSLTVKRWFRPEAIVNQHIFKVTPREGIPMWLAHAHLLDLLPTFQAIASEKATTMGHIQRHHLDELVTLPGEDAIRRTDEICRPLWRLALAAERETQALVVLRDAALTPLVAGDLCAEELTVASGGSLP